MPSAVVIGSGIGGIATSIRLAAKGFRVDVIEQADQPGGKLSEFTQDGFRFDFGPSLFTRPDLVDDVFKAAGRDPREYFNYHKLDIACRYFYPDKTVINAWTDKGRFAAEVEEQTGVDKQVLLDYLDHSGHIDKYTSPVFLENSLHKPATYAKADTLKAFMRIPSFDIFRTMNDTNEKRLGHPKLVQLFNRFATYNGSDPYRASGILTVIPSLEHNDGAYFPTGGMFAITSSLYELARESGVEFHFGTTASRIDTLNGRARAVETTAGPFAADVVVSNMDVAHTYGKLMPDIKPPGRVLDQEKSSSALVFYWGMDRRYEVLDVHNIFFSSDYRREFNYLFDKGDISENPTVYVNCTSKQCPTDAPEGMETWFTMINAPHDQGQDWDALISRTRTHVIEKLSEHLGDNIEEHVLTEAITDPRTIASKTLSHKGALYGSSSNSMMSAFFRHPNFSRKVKNLYFCGGTVHPGGGIPLCLLSAKIIDDLVK